MMLFQAGKTKADFFADLEFLISSSVISYLQYRQCGTPSLEYTKRRFTGIPAFFEHQGQIIFLTTAAIYD